MGIKNTLGSLAVGIAALAFSSIKIYDGLHTGIIRNFSKIKGFCSYVEDPSGFIESFIGWGFIALVGVGLIVGALVFHNNGDDDDK